ncbi:hypothetical protein C4565_00500 [Candidatus Parcubacteria bacterium]|nr:MAG: hypothetical protein C4565_00500 [Candidatus Parcubacteria bacterium]
MLDKTYYKILHDEKEFDKFVNFLPDLVQGEIYYLSLFARHKYCPIVSNLKDNQLARFVSNKENMKEHVIRLECPIGGYKRDGVDIPQEALALYIAPNPRSYIKANNYLLVELAKCISTGDHKVSPLTLVKTALHHGCSRKVFVDFDYDGIVHDAILPPIKYILPEGSYKILRTRGGFHLVITLDKITKENAPRDWYQQLSKLPNCDVKGGNTMLPVPGCIQGGFVPTME